MSDGDGSSDGDRTGSTGAGSPDSPAAWPVDLTGVTEAVVTTLGPNGRWNAAPLGLFAPGEGSEPVTAATGSVTATTWGNTRTRRNFHREGGGYVQFVADPVVFVDAALSIVEHEEPILDAAAAWVRVAAEPIDTGTDEGTTWERWVLEPRESAVVDERVPTIDRGFSAVVEASVLASRLGVPGYDDAELRDRLDYCASIVDRTGGPRDRTALALVARHAGIDLDRDGDADCETDVDDPPADPEG